MGSNTCKSSDKGLISQYTKNSLRMWRKGNPSALFVVMQTGAATKKASGKLPPEAEPPPDPALPPVSVYPEKTKTLA